MINSIETQLARDEGNCPFAYQDHLGFWTIGMGILIDQRKNGGLLPEEVSFIAKNRIRIAEVDVKVHHGWAQSLDPVRFAVLVNMAYQLGIIGLGKFEKFLTYLKAGNYLLASDEMLDSKWATQTPARAKRLSKQILTGEWQ